MKTEGKFSWNLFWETKLSNSSKGDYLEFHILLFAVFKASITNLKYGMT